MPSDVLEVGTRVASPPGRAAPVPGRGLGVPERSLRGASARAASFVVTHGLALSCALAMALRMPGFVAPLGNDEAGFAIVGAAWLTGATGPAGAQLYGAYWLDRPPLTPLLYGAADLAGGAVGVRLLGMVAALLVVAGCGVLARRIGGARTGAAGAALAAALTASPVLLADRAYGELVASAATVWSIVLLQRVCAAAGRPPSAWYASGAGVLASVGVLVKQSALDALLAGAVVCVVLALHRATRPHVLAWCAGVTMSLGAVLAWATLMSTGVADLYEALVGFRVDVLSARSSTTELADGWMQLLQPLALSGLAALAPLVVLGMFGTRGREAVLLGAWGVGCVVGVLGGGFNWSHYLIQLVPPVAVGAALGLRRAPAAHAIAIALAMVVVSVAGYELRPLVRHTGGDDAAARSIGEAIAARSEPGDTIRALHARPNVVHASGLPSTTTLLWRAMHQRHPDARRLVEEEFTANELPTWIVTWQPARAYGLDAEGELRHALDTHYREVGEACGRRILLRRDLDRAEIGDASVGC